MNQRVLLINYNNGSHLPFFPINLAYLVASLKRKGCHVDLELLDISHEPLSQARIENGNYDVIGAGFVAGYHQLKQAIEISRIVNQCKNRSRFKYVLGGHGPAGSPEYFLRKLEADHVVVGDGENAVHDLSGSVVQGGRCKPDYFPAYEEFPISTYRLHRFPNSGAEDFAMPLLSGRGCPYKCSFCFRMTQGFWPRSVEDVMEEMIFLHMNYGINHCQLADELLMSSESRAIEFSEAIMRLPFKLKWDCNGRLNFATPEVLSVMKRSGCNYINYGVEALDDEVLRKMRKKLTVETIYKGVAATIEAGIVPGLNLMWGNPGDTFETLEAAEDFLIYYDGIAELRTIRPCTPYPGCELFNLAVEQGKIKDVADFYENKHTNSDLFTVSFMDGIDCDKANSLLAQANRRLVMAYYRRCANAVVDKAMRFYRGEDKGFRGYRAI